MTKTLRVDRILGVQLIHKNSKGQILLGIQLIDKNSKDRILLGIQLIHKNSKGQILLGIQLIDKNSKLIDSKSLLYLSHCLQLIEKPICISTLAF